MSPDNYPAALSSFVTWLPAHTAAMIFKNLKLNFINNNINNNNAYFYLVAKIGIANE